MLWTVYRLQYVSLGGSLDVVVKERNVEFGNGLQGIISGASAKRGAVIITHGAGRGMDAPLLMRTAERLAELGFLVLRFNFGYLTRRGAPSLGGKNERPEVVAAIEFMKEHGAPVLIGKSFGGRVNSYLTAERDDVRALVFYGLPLQGASKNAKPRDWSHLGKIEVPMLFITGDRDNLCPLADLATVQKHIKAKFKSEVVPGDHSFKPKSENAALEHCVAWVARLG